MGREKLNSKQRAAVFVVFTFTLIGALALYWAFRWWNRR